MPRADETVVSPPASPRQVLLGLFILFQLAFLIVSNLLGFVMWIPSEATDAPKKRINQLLPRFADEAGHGWTWCEQVDTNLRRWTQLTGQDQNWALFSSASKATGFPAVVLIWDKPSPSELGVKGTMFSFDANNGFNLCAAWNHPPTAREPSLQLAGDLGALAARNPWEALSLCAVSHLRKNEAAPRVELLISANEPLDMQSYLSVGKCRLRRYEGQFYLNPQPYDHESPAELAARLTRRMRRLVSDYHDPAHEYLNWRLKTWQYAHPDEPAPEQVLLFHRLYRIHAPDEPRGWDGPYMVPLARWQPRLAPKNGYVLEPFDYTEQRFLPMSR